MTNSGPHLRLLIVDDEELAVDRLCRLCLRFSNVKVVGTSTSGEEALSEIERLKPDVVLLDITMPGIDGIEVGRRIDAMPNRPAVIFTTAHEEYALDAFSLDAVHYLLKPVLDADLAEAVLRVTARRSKDADGAFLQEIWVSRGYELCRLDLGTVEFIEADGDYMKFHAGTKSYMHYTTIKRLEAELDPRRFVRVHRSFIVARRSVKTISSRNQGGWELTLENGRVVPISATYLERVRGMVNR